MDKTHVEPLTEVVLTRGDIQAIRDIHSSLKLQIPSSMEEALRLFETVSAASPQDKAAMLDVQNKIRTELRNTDLVSMILSL